MPKLSLPSIILLAVPPTALAQGLSVGATAGVAATYQADLSGPYFPIRTVPRWTPLVGLTADWQLSRPVAVQSGVTYVGKGYWAPGYALNLAYLEFPLLARARLVPLSRIRPLFLAGIAPAVKVGCWEDYTGPNYVRIRYAEGVHCPGPKTNSWDVGLVGGVGMEYSARSTRVTADLRYTHGLSNFYATETAFHAHNRAVLFVFSIARGH